MMTQINAMVQIETEADTVQFMFTFEFPANAGIGNDQINQHIEAVQNFIAGLIELRPKATGQEIADWYQEIEQGVNEIKKRTIDSKFN